MVSENTQHADLIAGCDSVMGEIYARCYENAPNFGVSEEPVSKLRFDAFCGAFCSLSSTY